MSAVSNVKKKTYKAALIIFGIFSASAILGAIVGYLIDEWLGIRPWGTLGLLVVFYIASWAYVLKVALVDLKQDKTNSDKESTE